MPPTAPSGNSAPVATPGSFRSSWLLRPSDRSTVNAL
jgi:hypothetical protein